MISIIIPTFQAENYIENLLIVLRKQTIEKIEIIIIDSSSNDRTVEISKQFADKVLIIPQKEFNHGKTRNKAAKIASGEIIVFLTQDALPVNNFFLENLIKPLTLGEAQASYGRQIALSEASVTEKFARSFNYSNIDIVKGKADIHQMGIKTFFFTNVCSAIRRDAFLAVNCFPDKIILNEDMILAAKLILADYKVAYCSHAMVYHSHNYTGWQQLQRNFDIGVSLSINSWILDYAKPETEGIRYVKKQLQYILHNKLYGQLFKILLDNSCRYLGYKLGINYKYLPLWMRKKCSMHSFFWD